MIKKIIELVNRMIGRSAGQSTWKPASIEFLQEIISKEEKELAEDRFALWGKIKIIPEKWRLDPWGNEGGGFWVVGIVGKRCLYYNDIEEGFNWSVFEVYGEIKEYCCEQDTIGWAMAKLYKENVP